MKKPRPSAAVRRAALVALCASSLAAACSFPDVTFESDGSAEDTTSPEASLDATNGEGGVGVDTGGGDEGVTGADAPGADAPRLADVAAEVGSETGVDSGVDAVAPKDSGGVTDGPNCDCAASSMLPTNLTCPSVLGLNCKGSGFLGNPVCGTAADYYTCTSGLLACTPQDGGSRVQQCQ